MMDKNLNNEEPRRTHVRDFTQCPQYGKYVISEQQMQLMIKDTVSQSIKEFKKEFPKELEKDFFAEVGRYAFNKVFIVVGIAVIGILWLLNKEGYFR